MFFKGNNMITEIESGLEDLENLRESLEEETPNSSSTDKDEIEVELGFEQNQFLQAVESSKEFLDALEGDYEENISVRREWSIDRSGQEERICFQNKNKGSVTAEVPLSFKIGFDDKSPVLGFKDTISGKYEVPNLRYVSQGQSNSVSDAIDDFKDNETLLLNYNDFSVELRDEDEGWNIAGLEFKYNFPDQIVDPEKLKIPYEEIIEDLKEAADDNGIDYSEKVFESAAKEHEDYVEWATNNDHRYDGEDILNPEDSGDSGGLFDRIT